MTLMGLSGRCNTKAQWAYRISTFVRPVVTRSTVLNHTYSVRWPMTDWLLLIALYWVQLISVSKIHQFLLFPYLVTLRLHWLPVQVSNYRGWVGHNIWLLSGLSMNSLIFYEFFGLPKRLNPTKTWTSFYCDMQYCTTLINVIAQ